jgi:hypothetical protein
LSESDDGNSARLAIPIQSPRRLRWLFRLPADAKRTFELDETGLLVWRMCDGMNSVRKIASFVAMRGGAKIDEAELATMKFLQLLEARGLIHVKTDE